MANVLETLDTASTILGTIITAQQEIRKTHAAQFAEVTDWDSEDEFLAWAQAQGDIGFTVYVVGIWRFREIRSAADLIPAQHIKELSNLHVRQVMDITGKALEWVLVDKDWDGQYRFDEGYVPRTSLSTLFQNGIWWSVFKTRDHAEEYVRRAYEVFQTPEVQEMEKASEELDRVFDSMHDDRNYYDPRDDYE